MVYAGWMNVVLFFTLFISDCGPKVDFGLSDSVAYV